MQSFLEGCCETVEKKLGRHLQEEEINFLQWIYERYEEEQKSISSST